MPGSARGSVTVASTRHGDAPSVEAACSSRRSTSSTPSRTARTSSGKPMTAAASTAARNVNAIWKSNVSSSHRPRKPRLPRSRSSTYPVTTGGSTSGRWSTASTSDFPRNRLRARIHPHRIPGTRLTRSAHTATLTERRSADHSAGLSWKKDMGRPPGGRGGYGGTVNPNDVRLIS